MKYMKKLLIEIKMTDGSHIVQRNIFVSPEDRHELTDAKFKLLGKNLFSMLAEVLFPEENLDLTESVSTTEGK